MLSRSSALPARVRQMEGGAVRPIVLVTLWMLLASLCQLGTDLVTAQESPQGVCDNEGSYTACSSAARATRWKCWERSLTSSRSYVNGDHGVKLRVTLTQGARSLTRYAFWNGNYGAPNNYDRFTFRVNFPTSGIWNWSTSCESELCGGDTGLVTSGSVTVDSVALGETNPLYFRGALTQTVIRKIYPPPPGPYVYGHPQYADRTKFFWQGDTAWAATLRTCRNQWRTYVDDRKSKNFTVVQLLLDPYWGGPRVSDTEDLGIRNIRNQAPYVQVSPCTVTPSGAKVPNNCSRMRPNFWRELDGMVQYANDRGIVVAVASVAKPTYAWPNVEHAKVFARNLAARLGGHHVIFSPGADDGITDEEAAILRAVGTELAASGVGLRTNHYGTVGAGSIKKLHEDTWLNFHLFQTGHNGGNATAITGRPVTLTEDLLGYDPNYPEFKNPKKPVINGEGIYDYGYTASQSPWSGFRSRQVGYLSWFSGATGFTFGAAGLWEWGICGLDPRPSWADAANSCEVQVAPDPAELFRTPESAMVQASSNEARWLGGAMRTLDWWSLANSPTEQARICNNHEYAEDRKLRLSRDFDTLVVYMPHNQRVDLDLTGLSLDSMNPHAFNPRLGTELILPSSERVEMGNGRFCYKNPGGLAVQNLGTDDWVLLLRSSTTSPMAWANPTWNRLEVWPNRAANDGSHRLEAQVYAADGSPVGGNLVIASAEGWLPRKAAVGRDGGGNFIVAWESRSEPEGQSMLRVWRGSPTGVALGPFQDLEGDGVDLLAPSVSADQGGRFLVAWHERSVEDGTSRVAAQRFDATGSQEGLPFEIGGRETEEAASPKVACDPDGDCLVAWVGQDLSSGESVLRAQRLDKSWNLTGGQLEVWAAPGGGIHLHSVNANQIGEYELRWEEVDEAEESLGFFRKVLDVDGEALVGPELVLAPFTGCATPPIPCTL